MNISNRIALDAFVEMPIGEIAALPAEELALLQAEIDAALRRAKRSSDWLDGALALKYGDRLHAARQAVGKDTGTIRIEEARSLRTGKPSYRLELTAATGGK